MKIKLTGLAMALAGTLALAAPSTSLAAVCADHPNQASAQQAKDTRDADGDGVYCESLPCPCATGGSSTTPPPPASTPTAPPKPVRRAQVVHARITSVIDGDTIRVRAFGASRKYYTVRLIGIDTPETKRPGVGIECGGRQASSYMEEISFSADGAGRRVTLTTDPTQETFDRYGRLLAYVTTRSGTSLQEAILRVGWAKVYVYGGKAFQRVGRYRAAQGRARSSSRGVWRKCGGNFHRG